MPSPFPGMDPYLEDPGLWPDVHHGIISQMQAELNQAVGPKYYVRVEDRVYLTDLDDAARSLLIPDLRVGERPGKHDLRLHPGSTVALEVAEPEVMTTLVDDEIHEARLEVVDRVDRHVVTVIEVVSPSNKVVGSRGRASYQQKRNQIMNSQCHWVEIDLLRTGTALVPQAVVAACDYFIHVSRVGNRPKGLIWRIHLAQRLPAVSIPRKDEDPDVKLDLQHVFETAYERGAYDRSVDYRQPPTVPLLPDQASWADQLLKAKGLR
ncbi:MAG: DUF4058 family protein [Gemmataceae bacterium]|nr:DUF4058 family protein [Gemmataceae bacterium]